MPRHQPNGSTHLPPTVTVDPLGPKYIYVLKLEKHRWYVGMSRDPQARFQAHKQGTATPWTRLFKPLEMGVPRLAVSGMDEDNVTIQYMAEYGIDNVRGGTTCQPVLSPDTIQHCRTRIAASLDLCYHCMLPDHQSTRCPHMASTTVNGADYTSHQRAASGGELVRTRSSGTAGASRSTQDRCQRCRRPNHSAEQCYATRDVDGIPLCSRCGRINHDMESCYAARDVTGRLLT